MVALLPYSNGMGLDASKILEIFYAKFGFDTHFPIFGLKIEKFDTERPILFSFLAGLMNRK
jgi:hypothetical protein